MAKVTLPLGSAEARGSVGGFTYNTWRGIRTVKVRSGPKAEPSDLMRQRLAIAAEATLNWKLKTQEERDGWNEWAATRREPMWTGQDKRLTGYNWWVRMWVRLWLIDQYLNPWPPEYTIAHSLTITQLNVAGGIIGIFWDYIPFTDDADYWVETYLAGPLSAGRNATIHDAFRKAGDPYTYSSSGLCPAAPGTWTAFARLLHITGLATPFQSARLTIPP